MTQAHFIHLVLMNSYEYCFFTDQQAKQEIGLFLVLVEKHSQQKLH